MGRCVVVERLEGKQQCSRALVREHAELQAQEWPKWLFTEKRKVNEEQPNPQQPITQSRQRGIQTTSVHLHWCGANPPSSWPAHVDSNKGNPPKRGYIFAIFAGFFVCLFDIHHGNQNRHGICVLIYFILSDLGELLRSRGFLESEPPARRMSPRVEITESLLTLSPFQHNTMTLTKQDKPQHTHHNTNNHDPYIHCHHI